jgi:uncharacterized glyoxalase superfamily protein PhnB
MQRAERCRAVKFEDAIPVLVVDDVVPTRSFFVDRLGFAVVNEVVHEGAVAFASLQGNGVDVMVQSTASVRDDLGEAYVPGPYKAVVYMVVDDVEHVVPIVADADVTMPLRKTWYGTHEIGVREPGGHTVIFASRLPS